MGFIHQTHQSEWDDAYTNSQVTGNDIEVALVIVGIFILLALAL